MTLDFKTLTEFGLILGMIGTIILALPSLKSRFKNDKGLEGAPLGILEKPFGYTDDKFVRYCTWSGLGLVALGFLSQFIAMINLP